MAFSFTWCANLTPEEQQRLMPEPPEGPLSAHRAKATIDWRTMRKNLLADSVLRFTSEKMDILSKEPLFNGSFGDEFGDLSIRQNARKLTAMRYKRLIELNFLDEATLLGEPECYMEVNQLIGLLDSCLVVKRGMGQGKTI